jgi:uncharacterized damage-inducible protein DinB
MLALLRDLLAHAEWADSVFFRIWGASPARENEDLRARFTHILDVQRGFLAMLRGEAPRWPDPGPPAAFADLKARAVTSHAGLREFAVGLDDAGLGRSFRIPFFPDPPCVLTVPEGVVQVALHTQHHRGQCMTRLRDHGGTPENVDWVIWLWQRRPTAVWE